jgi:hypothetical protein
MSFQQARMARKCKYLQLMLTCCSSFLLWLSGIMAHACRDLLTPCHGTSSRALYTLGGNATSTAACALQAGVSLMLCQAIDPFGNRYATSSLATVLLLLVTLSTSIGMILSKLHFYSVTRQAALQQRQQHLIEATLPTSLPLQLLSYLTEAMPCWLRAQGWQVLQPRSHRVAMCGQAR